MIAAMDPVSPAELSPVAVQGKPVPLPYGLTWADLGPCLPGYAAAGSAWATYAKQGLHQGGISSTLLTLRYRDAGDHERHRTVFVKQIEDRGRREAARYRYLAGRGISVAPLLAKVDRGNAEVIIVEFLPRIGVLREEADELLALGASLNALADSPETVFALPPGMDQDSFNGRVSKALVRLADSYPAVDPPGWLDAYRRAVDAYHRLPHALTHGEFAPQQIGRTSDGKLVLFDLETAAQRPRFTDVAAVLRTLSVYTDRAEPELFKTYLHRLETSGGVALHSKDVWTELLLTRLVVMVESLPWLAGNNRIAAHTWVQTITDDLAALDWSSP
ncbi:MAG: hypothetical protein JWN06_3720 [Propionibacteriaceae bacterium]|nr:hypothetical protein [Propionibacteriaceae bacterium]